MQPTIVITGITRGIGKAIAIKFASAGFQIIGCARNDLDLKALQREYPDFSLFQCDVAQKHEIETFTEKILTTFPRIDLLINNAGQFIPAKMMEEEDAVFESQMFTNLFSAYYITKPIAQQMIRQNAGMIVNICSTASFNSFVSSGSYCVSKHALLGFSRILREELKTHQIRVLTLMPGATLTDSWKGHSFEETDFMKPDDLAETIWAAYQLPTHTVVEEIIMRPLKGDFSDN